MSSSFFCVLLLAAILLCVISCQACNVYAASSKDTHPSEKDKNIPPSEKDKNISPKKDNGSPSERNQSRRSKNQQGAMAVGLPLPGSPLDPVAVNSFAPEPPLSELAAIGAQVMSASEAAAEPLPPKFVPLPELGPQRMWQPTWQGIAPTFVDKACEFFFPNPRLWARDLNELHFRRGLSMGQDNLFEPVKARQSHIQLLAAEVRSKKDPYTKASMTNDLSHTTCSQIAQQAPQYVNF